MKIKAIFYDLDGTLRMNAPKGWQVFSEYAAQRGMQVTPEDVVRAARWEHYYFAQSPELLEDEAAFSDRSAFYTHYSRRQLQVLGASPAQAADLAPGVHALMLEAYRPADVIPADLLETLKVLQDQGYLLGVLSNRKESYADYLAELGLAEFFSLVIAAGEAGHYKPDPQVFTYMLEKAGVSAEESIYVGDNYYADVVGARAAGLAPVLLDIHGLFDEPGCPVIQTHSQLLPLLELNS